MNLGPVGLELTATQLRAIADGLDRLADSGVQVDCFVAHGVRVQVQWHEHQLDGPWYVVTGLERV